ncbi:MAG: endonuclease/exonuclease/phosphatase family protein, partial [Candidatus Thiodiazotropha sp.]
MTKDKKTEIEIYLQHHKPNIIGLVEINPKHFVLGVVSSFYQLGGYNSFFSDLDNGRGVVLYCSADLNATAVEVSEYEESVWCAVQLRGGDRLLVGCIYRSPNSPHENTRKLKELLYGAVGKKYSHLLIMGDFNFREIDWSRQRSSANIEHSSTIFVETLRDLYLTQHVKECTRFRGNQIPSLLDLVITNEEKMVENLVYLPSFGKSDHVVLAFTFICYTELQPRSGTRYNFYKGNYMEMNKDISECNWEEKFMDKDVCGAWSGFAETINQFIEKHVPVSRVHDKRSCPYADRDAIAAIRTKRKKWAKYVHCKNLATYNEYKTARNNVTYEMRRSKYQYEKNLTEKIRNEPKLFWRYVSDKSKTKVNVGQLMTVNGHFTSNDKEKAEVLNNYFASVFTIENQTRIPQFAERNFQHPLEDIIINESIVRRTIASIKPSKSQGPDSIHPKMVKECDSLVKPLTHIFRKSLDEGKLPVQWKNANVTGVFKAGCKSKPENYRPISVTSICCRILERIIR